MCDLTTTGFLSESRCAGTITTLKEDTLAEERRRKILTLQRQTGQIVPLVFHTQRADR